jgi:putative ABC transport system permease protein
VLARDLGYRPDNVLVVGLSLAGSSYAGDSTRSAAFWDAVLPALRTLPGVTAAAAADAVPFGIAGTSFVDLPGQPHARDGAGYRLVSDDYFRALGVPLLAGRATDRTDVSEGEPVVVVNATMAARFWPGESALGKRLRAAGTEGGVDGTGAPWRTVVGVVGDIRHFGLERDAVAEIYVPYRQHRARSAGINAVVRTSVPPASMAAAVRRRVHEVDARVAVETELLSARVAHSLAPRRFPLVVLSGFSALALLLAALGLYSLLAYTVAQRTRDLAVRLALGAARRRVLGLVLGEAARVLGAGAAAGVVGAWGATRLMTSMLAGVSPTDPLSLAAAVALLAVVGLAAAAVPTVRATRVDPIITLRAE